MSNVRSIKRAKAKADEKNPTVSVCMIVKNEAAGIVKAIESVKAFADEILVSDTGSTDDTVKLAREAGATVWEDKPILFMTEEEDGMDRIHFAENRNRIEARAKCQWILVLDGDEYLDPQPEDLKASLKQANKTGAKYLYAQVVTEAQGKLAAAAWQGRMYRRDTNIKWARPVHNIFINTKDKVQGMIDVCITSTYDNRSDSKESRSEPILLKCYKEDPTNPWPAFYLAQECLKKSKLDECKKWAGLVTAMVPSDPQYCRAWYLLCHALLMTEGLDAAERKLYEALVQHPNYPDLQYLRTVYSLCRWSVAKDNENGQSNDYMVTYQKSYMLELEDIAKALQIPWPYIVSRKVGRGTDDTKHLKSGVDRQRHRNSSSG